MKLKKEIIREILYSGPMSRSELSNSLKVSGSSVTEAVSGLLDDGVLYESGRREKSGKGRKSILLDIDTSFGFALGIGIHESTLCVGLSTLKGQSLEKRSLTLPKDCGPDEAGKTAFGLCREILRDCCVDPSLLIGIGVCADSHLDSTFLSDKAALASGKVPLLFESCEQYIEYSRAYMPISPEELYMFGCAKVIRDILLS